jgi:small conductance mechanosensitive channel
VELGIMDPLKLDQAALEKQFARFFDTGMDVFAAYGLKVLGAIVILILGWIVAGIVSRAILRAFGRFNRIDQTIVTFSASTAKYAVLTFTLIAVLSSVGVQTTSFVAVLGALGLAIGLALQGTLNHVASGLLLVIFRPFKVGDAIEAAGVAGLVKAITLFTTELATPDNIRVVVPNGAVWGGIIKNLSAHTDRRVDIEIGIAHHNDVEKVMSLLRKVIEADARISKQPAPAVMIARLTDVAVVLSIQAWVRTTDVADVRPSLNRAIKDAFAAEGVMFPAPPAPPASLMRP